MVIDVTSLSLEDLPPEILLKIFKQLNVSDLCSLKRTCKNLNEFVEKWGHVLCEDVQHLVTNQKHEKIFARSVRTLSVFEQFRISKNWRDGVYNEKAVLYNRTRYIPWIQLESDKLWLSRENFIKVFRRGSQGIETRDLVYFIRRKHQGEICRFVVKHNLVLSGQTDGSLWLWSEERRDFIFNKANCHESDINSVDFCDNVLVSGSRDNYVKIWRNPVYDPSKSSDLCHELHLNDRVWSVGINDREASLLAIGTAATFAPQISVYDIERHQFIMQHVAAIRSDGILDVRWENPSILWSSGYGGSLRRWDLRTGQCEQEFEDPFGASVYCFDYDYCNTVISGTHSDGRAVLWDTRQKHYVQMYFMGSCKRKHTSSPIYGLSFDPDYLFTVTDQHLNIMDFSTYTGKPMNYGGFYLNEKKT